MKKLTLILAIITSVFFFSSTSFAEQQALKQGGKELGLRGNIDFEGYEGFTMDTNVSLGYFVMDNLEVGGNVGFWYAESDPDNMYSIHVGPFAEYNFELESPLIPYVGIGGGYSYVDYGDDDDDSFVITGSVGCKYFMTETWAIDGSLFLRWATEDIYYNDGDREDTDYGITIGIRTYF